MLAATKLYLVFGKHFQVLPRACGVVVSRLLCMQKASGSNPDKSIVFKLYHNFCVQGNGIIALSIFSCVVGLVVRISAFQADGPGSIPGRRILFLFLFTMLVFRYSLDLQSGRLVKTSGS